MSAFPESVARNAHPYVILARTSIENTSKKADPYRGINPSEILLMPGMNIRRACFVSIKTMSGDLRGCIGTVMPSCPAVWEEIIVNAHAAACMDPRFAPVSSLEVWKCRISVDVLEEPELISDPSELDPKIYGVIVEKDHKKGVLLPNLDGVDSYRQQIAIAMSKANIYSFEDVTLRRFTVSRFSE